MRIRGARLLCDKVRPAGSGDDVKSAGGVILPAQSARTRASYGLRAHVLKVGSGCGPDITPGVDVIIDEFAGRPVWDDGHELPLWLVGESEVMVILEENSRPE